MHPSLDENTKYLGRIKSVSHAKAVAKELFGRLPRVGYEMRIDESEGHKTYLSNEAGRFRVWTYISPSFGQSFPLRIS